MSFGLNYGEGYIDNNIFHDFNRTSGLSFAASGVIEKPLSDIFRMRTALLERNGT